MTTNHDRLQWIKNKLALVPEGAAVLELARLSNATIEFDDTLPYSENGKKGTRGRFLTTDGGVIAITLNPHFPDTILVGTLAHELRHLWQHTKANFTEKYKLKPIDMLAFMRLIEGDANAFAALVTTKINKATKEKVACELYGTISHIDRMRGRHLNPDFVMPFVFSKFQTMAFNQQEPSSYETGLIEQMRKMAAEPNPYEMYKSLSETFNNISEVLSGGSSQNKNYLGAKNADDFVNIVEGMVRAEIRDEAKSYTRPPRVSIFSR